ncbi:MATE family efflux transporter [Mycoplasma iguanae]|uniref:Probable multidrug resistance protein NorM n=1 Tax=Mycoplasma iguanae TaxID=292461 RepID=A0ABY5RB37_9MOLU|nr:MATE family efflux transporter [Mycoplasma iguanae]UVD81430.1 MATE family efflux transporter [Mycoplasma iguanae]
MTKLKTLSTVKKFFPENKQKWLIYMKYSLPVIFSALLFSLNGFVDNFMVTHIANGVTSLSYANAWSGIIAGIVGGINFVGYVITGQYIGANKINRVKEIVRLRFLISFASTLIFVFFGIFMSRQLVMLFAAEPETGNLTGIALEQIQNEFKQTIDNSVKYLRLITIAWIILSWTSPLSSLLNETGNGKWGMYSSIVSLLTNIFLNIILMRVLNMGVEGAAYASIAARIVAVFGDTYFVYKRIPNFLINPLTSYKISRKIWKHFLKRSYASLMVSSLTIMIIFRAKFFNTAYPQGSMGDPQWALSAALVLGLTSSISEIFTTTFFAIGSNVTLFVGQLLGKREFDQAKKNANELKGFHTMVAFLFSLLLIILIFIIPHISGIDQAVGEHLKITEQLKAKAFYRFELQMTLVTIVILNPFWMWFVTSSRLISSGGKANLSSTMEIICEIIVICWAAIVCLLIVPATNIPLYQAYFLFFLGDFVKLIIYESVYFRVDWARHIDDYKYNRSKMKPE